MAAMRFGNSYVHMALGIFTLIFTVSGLIVSIVVRSKSLIAFFLIFALLISPLF